MDPHTFLGTVVGSKNIGVERIFNKTTHFIELSRTCMLVVVVSFLTIS